MAANTQTLTEIQDSYKNKERLIPFVGAGFSRNIDTYPTWDDFVALLKLDLSLSAEQEAAFDRLPNNLEKTEYYVRQMGKKHVRPAGAHPSPQEFKDIYKRGRDLLTQKIQDIFRDDKINFDSSKWSTHLLLLEKFQKMIYTTNWDNTFERNEIYSIKPHLNPKQNYAFSKEGNNDGKPRVIKYHGDFSLQGKELLVACLTDYQRRMSFDNCLDIKLKSDLLRYDFLLLGYSFNDPNIHLMIHHLSEMIEATNRALRGNLINTRMYVVVLEKPDDLRVNLLNDTFYNLRPYYLLEPSDYHAVCSVGGKCTSCKTQICSKCGNNYCSVCGHRCGMPISQQVKFRTEELLNSL